ncbi:hypothetical protein PLESTB_001375100 [Pleodorina starrii]|uniref:Oxidoreductase-like domain-containing protein n=1 Tax=Pleodorina starrii TaxID=330485 RepID=A0A9W6BVG2_9CHLO|nr:hypothetical protein PLESTM_000410000 [Pleodorina starrii]GLC58565.1 hypothetical protein PLESTB_001375100 [Pleodorina starrii]GLC74220.1 hypothetical protein PLESTF_001475100 [Pleodorina starrii]
MITRSVARFRASYSFNFHFRTIALPPKPNEPGPEECCQSGCNTCVWELYLEELAKWKALMEKLKSEKGDGPQAAEAAEATLSSSSSEPVGIAAFRELEKQLNVQQGSSVVPQSGSEGD